jgi:hypothetical protein
VQGESEQACGDVGVPDARYGAVESYRARIGAREQREAAHWAVVLRAELDLREAVGAD